MVHNFVLFILLVVTASSLLAFEYNIYAILLVLGIGIIVLFRLLFHTHKIFLTSVCFIILSILISFFVQNKINHIQKIYNDGFIYKHKTSQTIQGIIVEFPQYRFSNNLYLVHIHDTDTYIQIFTPLFQKFEYLDTIKVSGSVQDVRTQDVIWHRYYQRLGVQYVMLYPSDIKTVSNPTHTFKTYIPRKLFEFKKFIRQKSVERFSSHTSALVLGMLLGEKNELSKEEKDLFNTSQLSHILVVSGYNVSLVVLLLFWMMSSFNRYIKVVCTLIAILLFVLLIGYDASVVRAGLMGALLVIARILNRPKSGVNALCVVACGMILHNPLVIFDAGFHLSFIATYSLLIMPSIKKIPEYILSTVWIFLFVAPYILYMAGSVSFIGILSNIIVLFAVPFFMILSLVSLLLGVFNIFIGIDIFVLDSISRYIFFVAQYTQHAPRIVFELVTTHVFMWYLALFGILLFAHNRYTTEQYITKHYQKFEKQKTN